MFIHLQFIINLILSIQGEKTMENIKSKGIKAISIRYLLLYYLIYAIIGWLLETAYAVGTLGHFVKRGFLFGPLCPIYGWGAVILISFLKKYKSKPFKLFVYSNKKIHRITIKY